MSAPHEQPQQRLQLRHLFAFMTFFAMLFAVFVPWLRTFDSSVLIRMSLVACLQVAIGAAHFAAIAWRRSVLKSKFGAEIGTAYSIDFGHPMIGAMVLGFLFAGFLGAQVYFVFVVGDSEVDSIRFLLALCPLGTVYGQFFACWFYRQLPGSIVFYENGVGTSVWNFYPWEDSSLRVMKNTDEELLLELVGRRTIVVPLEPWLRTRLEQIGEI